MSVQVSYFEQMWASAPDPWGFETRWYEERKRAVTMSCLPARQYGSTFEPGCATGLLTEALAARSARLLATDVVPAPLCAARRRLADQPHVRVAHMEIPGEWPTEQVFDLIVLSEIGYYFDTASLRLLAERTAATLAANGTILACHWRHHVPEHPSGAREVHDTLTAHLDAPARVHHEEDDFILDVYAPRLDSPAVAGAEPLP